MKKILFIINPISGTASKENLPGIIERSFDPGDYQVECRFTEFAGHGKEVAKEAVEQGYDMVVATGGDGSVNEIGNSLVGTSTALGIIPLGSGNGLARHLGIPLNIGKALKNIANGTVKEIDSVEVNGNYFFNVAGTGFDGLIARNFARSKKRGLATYARIIVSRLLSYHKQLYRISINDQPETEQRSFMIVFANSQQYGNNFLIVPAANISDGSFDLCMIPSLWNLINPFSLIKWLGGSLYENNMVPSQKVRSLRISSDEELMMHLDGEPFTPGKEAVIQINPLSLKVIVPN
ncbi:MAG: diacylglycerol kinase family lipid kinase [Bacteroidetes bacterium]|nr:diacylglycerol kinase family lipid kinase [Bacteroidota bacterium]